ncbi:MAG: lysostaphin resistance A-like protein [Bacteroidota bacterium]
MTDSAPQSALRPWLSVLFTLVAIFTGFVVIGYLTGMIAGSFFYPGTFVEYVEEFSHDLVLSPKLRMPLLVMQLCATGFGLILTPWVYLKFIEKHQPQNLFRMPLAVTAALTGLVVMTFMVPDSMVIEWNSNLTFPGELDKAIREREELAAAVTKFLTRFTSFPDFLLGFVLIAVLPAIGEELAFRGMLQPALSRATGNAHVAIWVTAIIFSAFHFQFLGFVPRMLLGAMFGYMMHWSGNLWIPVIAHFVNNGASVILIYLHQLGITGFDAESTDSAPWQLVLPGLVLFIFLMIVLRKQLLSDREKTTGSIQ